MTKEREPYLALDELWPFVTVTKMLILSIAFPSLMAQQCFTQMLAFHLCKIQKAVLVMMTPQLNFLDVRNSKRRCLKQREGGSIYRCFDILQGTKSRVCAFVQRMGEHIGNLPIQNLLKLHHQYRRRVEASLLQSL
jgi:hypothetical protein